jgi:hypothetical protein
LFGGSAFRQLNSADIWENVDMRVLVVLLALSTVQPARLWGCSCAGRASTPCAAAGAADAAFSGTVLNISDSFSPIVTGSVGIGVARRRTQDATPTPRRPLRTIRIQVGEVLAGVPPGQKEIEIRTGKGGGDCGYPFQIGQAYVIYAFEDADGQLETGICSRTRPLEQAAEDLSYFHVMANARATGSLRVSTALPGAPAAVGATIIAESAESRNRSITNAAGDAIFADLPAGDYKIHAESDGDLPDDPHVRVHARGCASVTLFRTLRIVGHVTTADGLPAARIEVQTRSVTDSPVEGAMTGPDGQYEIRIVRPGQYYLGVNLNRTATRDTPYPRWF